MNILRFRKIRNLPGFRWHVPCPLYLGNFEQSILSPTFFGRSFLQDFQKSENINENIENISQLYFGNDLPVIK